MLNELTQRLLALHAGGIEKDFQPWVTDAVLARVLAEGVVLGQTRERSSTRSVRRYSVTRTR